MTRRRLQPSARITMEPAHTARALMLDPSNLRAA